jgi:ankyrin repeat protein
MHFIRQIVLLCLLATSASSFAAENQQTVHDIMLLVAKSELTEQQATVIVNELEEGGIDLDEQDDDGDTFLHFAVEQQNGYLAEALQRAGANPHIEDNNNRSPIEIAERMRLYVLAEFLEDYAR